MNELEKSSFEQQISVAMEQNIEMTRELLVMTKKIHRYMVFARLAAIFQVLLIVGPIIIGAIFLPSLLKNFNSFAGGLPAQFMQLNSGSDSVQTDETQVPKNLDLNSILKQYQEMQKSNK
jgi:hypothetical protein